MKILEHSNLQYLEGLLNSSYIGILVTNKNNNNLLVNQCLCEMFGYDDSELLGQDSAIFHISKESYTSFKKFSDELVMKKKTFGREYQFKHKNGSYFWGYVSGDRLKRNNEILWTIVDITKRINAEQKMTKLKDRIELAFIGYNAGVYEWNMLDNSAYYSPQWKKMLGYENIGLCANLSTWSDRVHPDDIEAVLLSVQQTIADKVEFIEAIHRLKHRNGQWIWILGRGIIQYNNAGQALRMVGIHTDITQQKAQEHRLLHQAQIIEQINDSVIATDLQGNITHWNRGSTQLLGYSESEVLGQHISIIYPTDDVDFIAENIKQVTLQGEYHVNVRLVKKSTEIIDASLSLSLLKDNNAQVIGLMGFAQDITERIKAEKKLADSNFNLQQYLDAIDNINIGLFVVDDDYHVRFMNKTMIDWFGDHTGEICYSSVVNLKQACSYCKLYDVIRHNKKVMYEPITPDGQVFNIVATSIRNSDGSVSKMEVLRNVTGRIKNQEHLLEQKEKFIHQAHHDALTGLPNRLLFNDRLGQSIENAKRNRKKIALLFIDLDHFKEINDSLGHDVGDKVLKVISKKLTKIIRQQDTLARLGGDEFTIILEDLKQGQDASILAQKIIKSLTVPVNVDGNTLYVSSSIGISLYPNDGDSAQNLLKYADSAMYKAKAEGRNNFQFYSAEMTEHAIERVVMEANFRAALKNNEFEVYYQPQINARKNKLTGMEALVRWRHPTMGMVLPAKFIALAETTGLIVELDRFVMKTAFKQFVQWYKKGLNPGVLALNLAAKQLKKEDFITTLKNTINEFKVNPEWLEFEITEGQIMLDPDDAIRVLKQIGALGIGLAVDDFGTGYSSLSYLKKLPINKLKIDQSFVRDLPFDEEDSAIAKAIIVLAQSLNLKIIAEGVEKQNQKEFLVQHGCDHIQGYYYSKPLSEKEMEQYLRS